MQQGQGRDEQGGLPPGGFLGVQVFEIDGIGVVAEEDEEQNEAVGGTG